MQAIDTGRVRRALGPDVVVQPWLTRAAWLAGRSDGIGASEAAMALGVSPYGTAFALWERKRMPRIEKKSDVLQRGHRWESAVLAEYEDESGNQVLEPMRALGAAGQHAVTLYRRDLPWLRQTPDSFSIDRNGELGQVEAKTALKPNVWSPEAGIVLDEWDDSFAELVPAHYAIQGYVQLIVSGLPWVDLCALVPRNGWLGVRHVRLQRDVETQAQIEAALTEWYQRHLVEGEPPAIDDSAPCNRYLAACFPSPSGKDKPVRDATDDEAALILELAQVNARAKADKQRHDELRNVLLAKAEGMRLMVGSAYGQPQNNAGKTLIDLDALREEAPELVAKHTSRGAPFATFNLYRFPKEETK
jgi:predicted phage-related endonuclease